MATSAGVETMWRAADAPGTRRVMRRRRAVVRLAVVAGIALIIIGMMIRVSDQHTRQAESTGRDTQAVLTEVVRQTGGTGPSSTAIAVTFHTADGGVHTGRLMLDRAASGYRVGDIVTVTYDVDDPSRFSIVGEPFEPSPIPWFVVSLFGVVFLGLGLGGMRSVTWTNRILCDNPWVAAESKVIEKLVGDGGRRVIMRMLELHGAPDDSTLAAPISWRAQSVDEFAPSAWIAGSDRRFLVAAPGGTAIHRFRRVRLTGIEFEASAGPTLRSRHTTRG
jgi:Protein of unknown function (DUF3592)